MIEVLNVTKCYGDNIALNQVSFTVNEGEILGFLGPNGAGKSTAMNIITGYISATEGNVKVDDKDILESPVEVKKKIGYLPEVPPLYKDMTVEEYLVFVSKIKKVSPQDIDKSIDRILETIKIKDVRHRLIKNLSKGYMQRVGLAQAIIGDPEVLILDEPTVGLDPKQIIEIRSLIKELGKKHTIILSSHILSEVSAICDRVLIINKGNIVASGTPEELTKKLNYSNKISLRLRGEHDEIIKLLNSLNGVENVTELETREPGTIEVIVEAAKDTDIRESLFWFMSLAGIPILMMKSVDLTLEDVFLQVTGGAKEEIKNDSSI